MYDRQRVDRLILRSRAPRARRVLTRVPRPRLETVLKSYVGSREPPRNIGIVCKIEIRLIRDFLANCLLLGRTETKEKDR